MVSVEARYTSHLLMNHFFSNSTLKNTFVDYKSSHIFNGESIENNCILTHHSIPNTTKPTIDSNFNIYKESRRIFETIGQTEYNLLMLSNIQLSDFELIYFKKSQLFDALNETYPF